MKIGDQVRFLSEKGGGRVTGFNKGGIVLVEDEDGFEIPMAQTDVVIVGEESYDTGRMVQPQMQASTKSTTKKTTEPTEEKKPQPPSAPAVAEERKGGNLLSVYIAYVPLDEKNISQCQFESYLVNDSNYYLMYTLLMSENNSWTLLHQGEIEPNTKEFIREVGRDEINALSRIEVQLLAYKKNKPFLLKSPIETQLRIDPVKFFKLHTFKENDFFEQAALLYSIVENDKVTRPVVIDAKQIQESLAGGKPKEDAAKPNPVIQKRKGDEDVVVVDLHADQLLDTTEGMSSSDILSYQLEVFRRTLAQYKHKPGQRIIFIHGKGEGVLRHALINDLNYRYKKYTYQDASFQEYQYGATQVTIK
ncbi:MAG: DUF2027 domain-containing protein [Prevotella sp.]|nr:DUF2027 domain-containing protein [Prevotella sp.]